MHVVTAEEMRKLDRITIEKIGIPSLVLMENAGRAVCDFIRSRFPDTRKWLILAGKGNNGGDGLVAARHLHDHGFQVHVVMAEPQDRLSPEASVQYRILENLGISVSLFSDESRSIHWNSYHGIIDSLLGTGTKGAARAVYASLLTEANNSGLPIVSVDIPSGLDADTGQMNGPCIQADYTLCLAFRKRGVTQFPGAAAAGEVSVVPIGIPEQLADAEGIYTYWITEAFLKNHFRLQQKLKRQPDTHKGTYGHTVIAAGSRRMSGAGILSAKSALRSGCGLVTWAVPDRLVEHFIGHVPEAMLYGLSDLGTGSWSSTDPAELIHLVQDKDALVIGPGMGRFENGAAWIRSVWENTSVPLVVDADALNLLADQLDQLPKRSAPTIATPHPGEMARLTKRSVRELQSNRIEIAREFAGRYGMTLILKGANSVIAASDGTVYINSSGNPGMATAGTGDVLAGMLGSLLAQGLNAAEAACFGAFMHGKAGDAAANRLGDRALLAGDVIESFAELRF